MPEPTPKPKSAMIGRLRRLGGYAFWTAAAFAAPVAIDRLIVYPALNSHFGEALFGAFAWVMAIFDLSRRIVSNGFVITLMRSLGSESAEANQATLRTALLLTALFACPFLIGVAGLSLFFAAGEIREYALSIYPPLLAFSLLFCLQSIMLAGLRSERRFRTIFLVKVVEGAVLCSIVFIVFTKSLLWVALCYVASLAASAAILSSLTVYSGTGSWYLPQTATRMLREWPAGGWLTFTEQSRVFAPRIILGILATTSDVGVLVAAMSIGNVIMMPLGMVGTLILSLLSKRKQLAFDRGTLVLFLATVAVAAVLAGFGTQIVGTILLKQLYPKLYDAAIPFFHWIAIGNAAATVVLLVKPVSLRYAAINRMIRYSVMGISVQLFALFILIPPYGARGAAIASALAAATAACAWLAGFSRIYRDQALMEPGQAERLDNGQ